MNKLSREKRNQLIAVASGVLVLCLALWYFVVRAQQETIEKTRTSIDDVGSKIEKGQRLVKRRTLIEAELTELGAQIAEAEAQMLPLEHLSGKKWILDKLLNFIKDQYDVTLMDLSNTPLTGKQFLLLPKFDPYSAAAYKVEMRGFFHEFGRFVADFENSFPYMRILDLEMWPLATPAAARVASPDLSDELLNSEAREQLRISLRIVVLFKPANS
ncbi:MAG: hypothetical protein FJ398_17970 [Verrucomicrobia bacterium]|nr:hypothetical protein [Verrucomicrobiota bacterium]